MVVEALERLLRRHNRDAYVVFENRGTGKFVQFACGPRHTLVLDLPHGALTEEELSRAADLFQSPGVSAREDNQAKKPWWRRLFETRTFQIDLGTDPERVADLVLGVFERVYRAEERLDLDIEEN
jgi:hypothetical protein